MEQSINSVQLTLRDYFRVLFRQKAVIITAFITVILTVFVGLKLRTPVYEARVKLLISAEKQVEAPYYRDLLGTRYTELVLTQSEIVKSRPVIERVVKTLGLNHRPLDYEKKFASPLKSRIIDFKLKYFNPLKKAKTKEQREFILFQMAFEDLKRNINVEPIRDTDVFIISVRDYSPVGAAILANVVSRSYLIFDLEQQLAELELKYGEKHPTVLQLRDNIEKMKESLNGKLLSDIEAIGPASVKIVEQATIPLKPIGPSDTTILILAFFMSIFLGVMLAFVFEFLDQTFKSPQEIETVLGLTFLGGVPKKKAKEGMFIKDSKKQTPYTKSYQILSDQVYLVMRDRNLKSLLFASVLPAEGTSSIVANMGVSLAEGSGHRVLVIDANLRNPSMHKIFNLKETPGLAQVLEGKVSFDKMICEVAPDLDVLPAGRTDFNPLTLLDSHNMGRIIKEARDKYEVVLVDSPNLRSFKDGAVISSYSDGIILVISEGRSRKQVVKSAISSLGEKKGSIMGVILNRRKFVIPRVIYERV
ncbi:MAG: lipopolysaccharide biosynthesis protein [Candidatus Latescibacterota bacterium]|nr:MAG: lipopolysaccharide biosynthesis protein [Candidatus Latescibacterota bacterium]